jgi:hypothetical protein
VITPFAVIFHRAVIIGWKTAGGMTGLTVGDFPVWIKLSQAGCLVTHPERGLWGGFEMGAQLGLDTNFLRYEKL